MNRTTAQVSPDFPARPTPEDIAREYTPERVTRLARFVASRRGNRSAEQYEEDISQCILFVYQRIDDYVRGRAEIPDTYPFYHWLLFHVKTDLRDARRKESRSLGTRSVVPLNNSMGRESTHEEETDTRIDVRGAMARLTSKQRTVLEMYYNNHLTQQMIADTIGVSQPAVAELLKKGREKLEKLLGRPTLHL